MSKVKIEIDGKEFEVDQGKMVIEAADANDIYIPRFCYHKKLSIVANCRMCLVEVEKVGKPLPACATPVSDGMKVFTCSEKAKAAQKAVMEFLLINHPLDCPICDQGGECELQDLAMGYGSDISEFTLGKRSIFDENLGSLISTDMTRCIQCTRCVRFGEEVAGMRELGATGRGEDMEIGTYIKESMKSEVSGNIIDLCPVGALTSKPFRFRARAWEMQQRASIAAHDCLGSNIYMHTLRKKVMRVAPRDNESTNEMWLSDRDRFSYEALTHEDRLTQPMVKTNGQWQTTDWKTALNKAVAGIKKVIDEKGAEGFGGLISPNATVEEMHLLTKIMRTFGSDHIDHRVRQTYINTVKPEISFAELEEQQAILLVGSNLRYEQPLAAIRVRKAAMHGAKVMAINSVDYDFTFPLSQKEIVKPDHMMAALEKLGNATELKQAERSVIILGATALNQPNANQLVAFAKSIADKTNSKLLLMTDGANSTGACLLGAYPTKDKTNIFEKALSAYLLVNVEPELDCINPQLARNSLEKADFVVSLSPFQSDKLLEVADVILPSAPYSETSGTFVNVMHEWQSFSAATPAQGEARPAWKILRVLGNLFELPAFGYQSSAEVLASAKENIQTVDDAEDNVPEKFEANDELVCLTEWPIYQGDSLVRRAKGLQASALKVVPAIYMNETVAKENNLSEGQTVTAMNLPVMIDNRVADKTVLIPAGFDETAGVDGAFCKIKL